MATSKKLPEKVFLISPHQNERPTAVPFLNKLARDFQDKKISTEGSLISGTSSRGWYTRKLLVERPDYPQGNVNFLLSMADAIHRSTFIGEHVSPKTLIVEVHAWVPSEGAGFALEDQHIGNGFNLLPFIKLMEHYYGRAEKYPEMMQQLNILLGKGKDAMQLLFSTQKKINSNKENIVCIEIPGTTLKPMVVEGKPLYSLYYNSQNDLLPQISDFEKLYCTHAIHGKGYADSDVAMVSKLLLDKYQ